MFKEIKNKIGNRIFGIPKADQLNPLLDVLTTKVTSESANLQGDSDKKLHSHPYLEKSIPLQSVPDNEYFQVVASLRPMVESARKIVNNDPEATHADKVRARQLGKMLNRQEKSRKKRQPKKTPSTIVFDCDPDAYILSEKTEMSIAEATQIVQHQKGSTQYSIGNQAVNEDTHQAAIDGRINTKRKLI